MMKKIAINGFGRIGRGTFRALLDSKRLEIAAINDLTDIKTLAHLLNYDSVYGRFPKSVKFDKKNLIIGDKKIPVFSEKNPKNLPWSELKIDLVFESTGVFRKKEDVIKHIQAGAKKVIISAPPKSKGIKSIVMGVNENDYNGEDIVSNCSCTTNCLAPVVKVLNDSFGIKKSFFTTVHSYTTSQNLLDSPHKDLRRARAAALNMVPTTTGASQSVVEVIPELKGKLYGKAIRVPTPLVSLVDLVVNLEKNATIQEINNVFKEKSQTELKGILGVSKESLVSSDYIKDSHSAIVDLDFTLVSDNVVKIFAWYDNEYGYSCRMKDLAEYIICDN
ncbi:MAG TPA: type I glyceraldehyde-3-phosphate dehydrogenase [Patescibacteria group bacterium]|nr:type I glyceraldehyde-3-phosphate dehydrogenase [Patescibacteria group bacterium]